MIAQNTTKMLRCHFNLEVSDWVGRKVEKGKAVRFDRTMGVLLSPLQVAYCTCD